MDLVGATDSVQFLWETFHCSHSHFHSCAGKMRTWRSGNSTPNPSCLQLRWLMLQQYLLLLMEINYVSILLMPGLS